jgi:hypothetical protein
MQLNVHLQGGQMVHEAVLDYFAQSVWYEPNCVNELAKAQNLAVWQIKCAVAPPNIRPSFLSHPLRTLPIPILTSHKHWGVGV